MFAARKLRWRKSRNSIIGFATRSSIDDEGGQRLRTAAISGTDGLGLAPAAGLALAEPEDAAPRCRART